MDDDLGNVFEIDESLTGFYDYSEDYILLKNLILEKIINEFKVPAYCFLMNKE